MILLFSPPPLSIIIIQGVNCQHPAIFIGDFNCHNNLWGYAENDENGELLLR
jgi:hypothetical protein